MMLVKITVETDDAAKRALYLEELMETLVAMYSNDHEIHHTHKVEIGGTWIILYPVEMMEGLATDNPWAHFNRDSPLTVGRLLKSDSPST